MLWPSVLVTRVSNQLMSDISLRMTYDIRYKRLRCAFAGAEAFFVYEKGLGRMIYVRQPLLASHPVLS